MTRQNQIPSPSGDILALIPLWDMINHCEGEYTTHYNMETDCLEFFSMGTTHKDEQVYMFYGPRPNAELLVHSGFVYENNRRDKLEVSLNFERMDPLLKIRKIVLDNQKIKLVDSAGDGVSDTLVGSIDVDGSPSEELIAGCRVMAMNKAEIGASLREGASLCTVEKPPGMDEEVEERAKATLRTLLEEKLSAYPTVDADRITPHGQLVKRLCDLEKHMLTRGAQRVTP